MGAEVVVHRGGRLAPAWLQRAWQLIGPRAPAAFIRLLFSALLRLPRRSRARRGFVVAAATIGWDLTASADMDPILPFWDSRAEWHWDSTFTSLGFDAVYKGHEGVRRSLAAWSEIWTDRSFTVREILDGGDTWVMRVTARGRGIVSGAPVQAEFSAVARLRPLIVDFRNFNDDEEALREAGFGPPA